MEQSSAVSVAGSRWAGRGQGGFTLIEALVVVALMAILGGVAVFAVTELFRDSEETACISERRTIETAMWAENNTGNTADTYGDYLSNPPKYFSNSGSPTAPVWGPGAEHPAGSCPATIPVP